MAQLREMSYGCRSYVLGVQLQGEHQDSSQEDGIGCPISRDEFELNCALPFANAVGEQAEGSDCDKSKAYSQRSIVQLPL